MLRTICAVAFAASLFMTGTAARATDTDNALPDAASVNQQCDGLRTELSVIPALSVAYQRVDAECKWFDKSRNAEEFFANTYEPAQQLLAYWKTHGAQTAGHSFVPTEQVPSNKDVYVLFLVTDMAWGKDESGATLHALHEQFNAFGDAIGDNHLAVWFRSAKKPDVVDIKRSKTYFVKLGLQRWVNFDEGPFVVITSVRPDKWNSNAQVVVGKLGNMTPANAKSLLHGIELDLATKGYSSQHSVSFNQLRGDMVSFVQTHGPMLLGLGRFVLTGSLPGK